MKKPAKKTKKTSPKKHAKKKPTNTVKAAAKTSPPEAKPEKKAKEETMDRSALKVIASQLKDMGADIKALKSDSDELLQKKVNEQLKKMPKDDVLNKLETIIPDKLVTVLKRDCVGIFIDLSDVSCIRCKDAGKCASQFLKNLRGGFSDLSKALPEKAAEEKPVVEKAKLKAVSRYEEDRLVFVRDVKNPNPKSDPFHDTLQAVLDEQPGTLSELREIVERDFDLDSDGDFMKFVTSMRDPIEGVIKLDVDLSEKNKKELREAGVDI